MEESDDEELIPGLPNDCALQCLIKVSPKCMKPMKGVCRIWRRMLLDKNSVFYKQRLSLNIVDPSLFMIPSLHMESGEVFHSFGCVPNKTDIFILGGNLEGSSVSEFWIVDTITHRVRRGPNMLIPRERFICGVLDGKLYAIGGYCTNGKHSEIIVEAEYYDFYSQTWNYMNSLPFPISSLPFTLGFPLICYTNFGSSSSSLFITGFRIFDGILERRLVTLKYFPTTDSWTEIGFSEMENQMYDMDRSQRWRWCSGQLHLNAKFFKGGDDSFCQLLPEMRVATDFIDALLGKEFSFTEYSFKGSLFWNENNPASVEKETFIYSNALTCPLELRGLDQNLLLDMFATNPMAGAVNHILCDSNMNKSIHCKLVMVMY